MKVDLEKLLELHERWINLRDAEFWNGPFSRETKLENLFISAKARYEAKTNADKSMAEFARGEIEQGIRG